MIENPNVICNDCAYCKQNKELKKQLAIAISKLDVAKELLSAGKPMVYMALEHIEYALERIEAIDKIRRC